MKTILTILFALAIHFALAQDTTIKRVEYFVDVDPGVGYATAVDVSPSGNDILFSFPVNTSAYTPGFHKLYFRTMDTLGRWSLTLHKILN